MRLRAALLCLAALLAARLELPFAQESPRVMEKRLELGVPLEVNDLEQYSTRCYLAPAPDHSVVRVLASAVALSGNPSLRGGWESVVPGHDPDKTAGYETLDTTVPRDGDHYYVCVRTFSAQGCDLVLTVLITGERTDVPVPRITMRPLYPTIWPLGLSDGSSSTLRFGLKAGSADVHISAVAVTGEVKVSVFKDSTCDGKPLKSSVVDAPAAITVKEADHDETLCVKAHGTGAVSLTAALGSSLPLLAPAVPSLVKLAPGYAACEQFALALRDGVSVTITATSEDGSLLHLDGSLNGSDTKLRNRFDGEAVPGGEGAVLEVTGSEVADAKAALGKEGTEGKAPLQLRLCRAGEGKHEEPTLVWLTAVTDSTVVTLSDGLQESIVIPRASSNREALWRDFRFFVPGGKAKPKEITITGSSSGKARLVADTTRFPHDSTAYRWMSAGYTSEPMIRLTTDISLRSEEVHLIDCRFPCYVYISASAWTENRPELDTDLQVLVTMESDKPIPLVEGQEYKQRLTEHETQMFAYQVKNEEKPVLFTISTIEGVAELRACATVECDPKTSTTPASDAIDLGPSNAVFMAALGKAQQEKMPPVIYLQVASSGKYAATFSLVARLQGDAQILRNGDMARGAVEAGGYDHYKFFIGEEEVAKARKDDKLLSVSVQISPVMGNPSLYVSCSSEHPDEEHYDWGGSHVGEDAIYFTSMSVKFKSGWIHVGIPGKEKSAYAIRVTWGNASVQLQDGMEELGNVMKQDVRTYSLVVADRQLDDKPVAVRAVALIGSISVCVHQYKDEDRQVASQDSVCRYKASAASDSGQVDGHLAALDIPPSVVKSGGRFVLLVQGMAPRNVFSLRAVVDAPATIAEGHDIVDSLAPACCVVAPTFLQLLTRSYVIFVRPVVSATLTISELGVEGHLAGATVMAREHGMKEGFRKWDFEAHSPETIEKFTSAPSLKLDMDLKDITKNGRSFWLEIKLEAKQPVNYTMHLGTTGKEQVFTAPQQLIPGETMKGVATKDEETKYEFAIDTRAADRPWHLKLQQCYGHIGYKLPYAEQNPDWEEGDDMDILLPVPRQSNSGSINADGNILVKPMSATPVLYEMKLTAPGKDHLSLIKHPKTSKLKRMYDSHSVSFGFQPSKVNRKLLKDTVGASTDAELFYTLVAVPANDSMANSNSACGLAEAMKHAGTVSTRLDQGLTLGLKRLSAQLPDMTDGDFVVNVMVTLISDTGKTLASSSYEPYHLDVSVPYGRSTALFPAEPANKMFMALMLVGCLGCCWCMTSHNGPFASSKGGPHSMKVVEMDDAYEMQDSFGGDHGASLLSSRSGNYVPPSV